VVELEQATTDTKPSNDVERYTLVMFMNPYGSAIPIATFGTFDTSYGTFSGPCPRWNQYQRQQPQTEPLRHRKRGCVLYRTGPDPYRARKNRHRTRDDNSNASADPVGRVGSSTCAQPSTRLP
jgi:hypothetical protein